MSLGFPNTSFLQVCTFRLFGLKSLLLRWRPVEGVVGLEKGKCPVLGRKLCLSTVPCAVTLTNASWLFSSPLETPEGCRGLESAHCTPPSSPGERRFFLGFPWRVGHWDGKCYFPSPARASREVSWGPHSKDPLGLLWAKPTVTPPPTPAISHSRLVNIQPPSFVKTGTEASLWACGSGNCCSKQTELRHNSPHFRLSRWGVGMRPAPSVL